MRDKPSNPRASCSITAPPLLRQLHMRQMGIVQDPRAPYQERIISCFGASHTAPKRARFATRFGSLKNSVKRLSTAYLHFARVSIFIFITYDQKFIYSLAVQLWKTRQWTRATSSRSAMAAGSGTLRASRATMWASLSTRASTPRRTMPAPASPSRRAMHGDSMHIWALSSRQWRQHMPLQT